jgi:hypothetical protein
MLARPHAERRVTLATRTVRIKIGTLGNIADVLTGYGTIERIEPDGSLLYKLENEGSEFQLGRLLGEIEIEILAYDTNVEVTEV